MSANDEHEPWIGSLEAHKLRELIGSRTLELALASDAVYIVPPALGAEGVTATVEDSTVNDGVGVLLRGPEGTSLAGRCDRCRLAFGPCVHMGTVALDLALSPALRSAVLDGDDTRALAAEAPAVRRSVRLERNFEQALSAWLVASPEQLEDVEIAASPVLEAEAHMARGYGDRVTGAPVASLAVFVRRRGDRRFFTPREVTAQSMFAARDRLVLTHVRDRGGKAKSAFASGNEASLALEAMRVHGGIFSAAYKGKLDFRAPFVRPGVRVGNAGVAPAGFEALTAFWVNDEVGVSVSVRDATLFVGPFPFVWTASGAIYRVAREVDLGVAQGFVRQPTLHVPRARMKDAGTRLLHATRGRGVTLPGHEVFGLPPQETPRIVVRLEGEPLAVHGDAFAVYRHGEHSLYDDATRAREDPRRDLDCEERAREALVQAGLVSAAPPAVARESDEEHAPVDATDAADAPSGPLFAAGDSAVAFWRDGLAALRAAQEPALAVELTARLAGVRIGTPLTAHVHVSLEGHWLKTKLDFRSEDLEVELAQVRAALVKKRQWVALDDGTLARISSSVAALVDEAGRVMPNGASEANLPAHQLGRLDRWIEQNDGRADVAVLNLRKQLRTLAVSEEPIMPRGLDATLRPYQRRGLAWLQFLDALSAGGIFADDMGLGKTITTLAFLLGKLQQQGAAPSLVVCPTSVATNWVREAARFTPDLKIALFHGVARDAAVLASHDIVVTTYAILRRDADLLARTRFRCVVLDEAQNIKNALSATTRAALRLDADMRLALSGTPLENRLGELWSLASFANPGMLGSARAFESRYERPIEAKHSSPLAGELRAVLRPFLLRRTKADVLSDLPPKTEMDRVVSLSTPDKRLYDALAITLRDAVKADFQKRKGIPSTSVFAALTRLRQMACDPRLVDARVDAEHERIGAKREAFLELVRELVAEGRRALVFSQFVSLLTLWRRDLDDEHIPYEYLDGSTTHRDVVVARFQEGTAPLFLISLKAGGSGLNLTAADTVIHCDPWWNPAVEDQATDRAHRIGQDKPVTVVRLVARGTIEEKILVLKAKKRELANAVIADDASALSGISAEELAALLGVVDDEGLDDAFGDNPDESADLVATMDRVIDSAAWDPFAKRAMRFARESGRKESEIALLLDMPAELVARLVRGMPFPCTRIMAERSLRRIRNFR